MIQPLIEKYSYLEKSDHPSKMAEYLLMWKDLRKSEVAETTYDGYHTYIDRHLVPYFKTLNLNIQDITAGHIFDYVNYLSKVFDYNLPKHITFLPQQTPMIL